MLDGTVETTGTDTIYRSMNMPTEYYNFIMITAGIIGTLGTVIFDKVFNKINETLLLIIVIAREFLAWVEVFINFMVYLFLCTLHRQ